MQRAFACSRSSSLLVAKHAQAGQFVIFRLDEQGERTPVSVAGYDREKGTVTVMVQAATAPFLMLHTVQEGDYITMIRRPPRQGYRDGRSEEGLRLSAAASAALSHTPSPRKCTKKALT